MKFPHSVWNSNDQGIHLLMSCTVLVLDFKKISKSLNQTYIHYFMFLINFIQNICHVSPRVTFREKNNWKGAQWPLLSSILMTHVTSSFRGLTKGQGLICSHLSLGWVVDYSVNIPSRMLPPLPPSLLCRQYSLCPLCVCFLDQLRAYKVIWRLD